MPTNFPVTSVDTYTDKTDSVDDVLAAHVNDLQDAMEAVQAKLGIDASAVSSSIDYIIKNTTSGHDHDGSDSKKVLVTNLDVTGLTVSQLVRVNAGGTAVESSGKTVPSGTIVGTTDSQTLTNKTLTSPIVTGGTFTTPPANIARVTGEITLWTTSTPPTGWLLCDGSEVDRTTYATLFGVVGTTFGVGDGSTTFNLPNYTDRLPVGKSGSKPIGGTGGIHELDFTHDHGGATGSHTLTQSEMPVHSHGVTDPGHTHTYQGSAEPSLGSTKYAGGAAAGTSDAAILSSTTGVSIQNAGGGAGHTHSLSNDLAMIGILNPYLGISFIIKT
jgi:microcystin-dependent protein